MPKKMKKDGDAEVHKDLTGFDIGINEFGEIKTNLAIDKLNGFLDKNLKDKKITDEQE